MPLLELRNVSKRYPGVVALDRVSLALDAGEVLCLVGENGAGKSTLVKILSGALQPDEGEILFDGDRIQIPDPIAAIRRGIGVIYQEFNLVPYLSVAENVFLGREPKLRYRLVDFKRMRRNAQRLIDEMGIQIDAAAPLETLSVAKQQIVEIAKALSTESRLLIMDEPSATLTQEEIAALFRIIRKLRSDGRSIIYISHRLEELFEIADRVVVLRDGKHVSDRPAAGLTKQDLIRDMVGREIGTEFPKASFPLGEPVLKVRNLTMPGKFRDVSFDLRRGEILGIAGLVGAGRTEIAKALFGAYGPGVRGEVELFGKPYRIRSPLDSIRQGLGLVVEDRKKEGLVLMMNVKENTTLTRLSKIASLSFIQRRKEESAVQYFVKNIRIKTPTVEKEAQHLSGGNQQKVVLSKWLFSEAKVVLFDEPTRGIDVGAKLEIYTLLNELVAQGLGVVMISSELPEIVGMCDRVMVIHEGRVAGFLDRKDFGQEEILRLATGGER
jgi:ABC-type sugar transport system ATPase subunit